MKKFNIFIIVSILVFCYTFFFSQLYGDEIWNYGFAYNLSVGLIPYKDFNMIITPLYSFIISFFIKIFGHHLCVIHIFNSIMLSIMFFVMYKKINKKCFLIIPLVMYYSYPGYNIFCLFLIIILFYFLDLENIRYKDIIISLIVSCLFLTKQTIGIACFIPMIKFSKNKIKSLIMFLLPIFIFLIYLLYYNAFYDFINYCFLGMLDFSSENSFVSPHMFLTFISVIILIVYNIKKKFKDIKLFYLLMFQIICFPIFDDYHFMMGFILILYYLLNNFEVKSYRFKYYLIIVFFFVLYWDFNINDYSDYHLYSNKYSYLYRRYVPKSVEDILEKLSTYIDKSDDVYDNIYLLTSNSYMIKLNTNSIITKFDLINNGNMGYNGGNNYIKDINDICSDKKCLFILYKYEFSKNNLSQTNKKIIRYVKNTYNISDKIGIFDIYIN